MLTLAAALRQGCFAIKGLSLEVKSANPQGPETIAHSESKIPARSASAPSSLSRKVPRSPGVSAAGTEGETVWRRGGWSSRRKRGTTVSGPSLRVRASLPAAGARRLVPRRAGPYGIGQTRPMAKGRCDRCWNMADDDWRRARRSSRGRRGGDDGFSGEDSDSPAPAGVTPFKGPYRPSTDNSDNRGSEISAVVTRFDTGRGFGFVALDGAAAGDAFLHVSVLQRAGVDSVVPGTCLRVRIGRGEKGPQVTEVLEVGTIGDVPPRPGRAPRLSPSGAGGVTGEAMRGTVKWYSAEKGYGFISPDGGGADVFVHATTLERSGTAPLTAGQAVAMRVVEGRKGPEAETVRDP